MGITKIFKEKPKDEDAALPEKEGKKIKKKDKKNKSKSQAAPAEVSHATVESEHAGLSVEDDRALAGLSPAAKLARQHTLKSKAEQAKHDAANRKTGEPTWDNNTATKQQKALPSISSVAQAGSAGPEVLHITPGRTSTVVHAIPVDEQEYDSEDDSSDGETIEDVTMQMARVRMSDGAADKEFRETWGNAYIDKDAVPKKGILKSEPFVIRRVYQANCADAVSFESLEQHEKAAAMSRQRSNSTAEIPHAAQPHVGHMGVPVASADQIDGIHHSEPAEETLSDPYNPFSPSFSPFDSPSQTPDLHAGPYSNPAHNTSAPTLSLINPNKPVTPRSMTAPANRRRIIWAPECAVYSTYDAGTYDRRGGPVTCNMITPELANAIRLE